VSRLLELSPIDFFFPVNESVSKMHRNSLFLIIALAAASLGAAPPHDLAFWRGIGAKDFAVPAGESVGRLALEIVDLAGNPDPALRDECGYDILAAWAYGKNLLTSEELEAVRRKLIPGMIDHIGQSGDLTIFRRSFSALYMSILAAQDTRRPFLTDSTFHETLSTALKCYAMERDLRGYTTENGWAHATAHVADLLKFLGRNTHLTTVDQQTIVRGIVERCRTFPSVFVWGEDARIAAALSSLINRKDFDRSAFEDWFAKVIKENKVLWKAPKLDPAGYVRVRTQTNVLAQLAARLAANKPGEIDAEFLASLTKTVAALNQ
jgi:hypothetical protein